jgi:hypothetical protein
VARVPVGAAAIATTLFLSPESHADLGHRRFDVAGAVTVTAPHGARHRSVRRYDPGAYGAASKIAGSVTDCRSASARLTAFTTARSDAVTMLGWSPTPHTASSSTSAST